MKEELERTERLIGEEAIKKIQNTKVAIFRNWRCGILCSRGISESRNSKVYIN